MRAVDAYADLRRFGKLVITTEDGALRMGATLSAASRTLSRLAAKRLIVPLRRGLWSLRPDLDPLLLPEYLTAPLPAYVSLQSALYFHGMISRAAARLQRPRMPQLDCPHPRRLPTHHGRARPGRNPPSG